MIIGQVLKSAAETDSVYYSPWIPAGGNLAVVSCEVIETLHLSAFTIEVETKNTEDPDSGHATPANDTIAVTLGTETITKQNVGAALSSGSAGFKELFRYKYVVSGQDGSGGESGFVHFRMLDPAWLTN